MRGVNFLWLPEGGGQGGRGGRGESLLGSVAALEGEIFEGRAIRTHADRLEQF